MNNSTSPQTLRNNSISNGTYCMEGCGRFVVARNAKVGRLLKEGHPIRCDDCQRQWNERQGWGR